MPKGNKYGYSYPQYKTVSDVVGLLKESNGYIGSIELTTPDQMKAVGSSSVAQNIVLIETNYDPKKAQYGHMMVPTGIIYGYILTASGATINRTNVNMLDYFNYVKVTDYCITIHFAKTDGSTVGDGTWPPDPSMNTFSSTEGCETGS